MRLTADHGEIRGWIERHGGCPTLFAVDGRRDRLGVTFEGAGSASLSWDEFFDRFDREGLAFEYSPDANGEGVRSAKLVSR